MSTPLDDPFAGVLANLDTYAQELNARANRTMETIVTALANWAKTEHNYTDRTGNLTNSIRGFVIEATGAGVLTGALTATMEYAIFVELARNGKWAFLQPTINRHEADIMRMLQEGMK